MPTPDSTHALKLLGGAIITVGDTPLGGPAAHRHPLALLALLATTGRPMTRDKIVAYLWPERDTESARNLLKTSLHSLRKVLGDAAILNIGDQLTVDRALLRCDVAEFEAAVAAGDVETAAKLYAGPFLDGFFLKESTEFEEWTAAHRTRLEVAYAEVREALATRPAKPRAVEVAATSNAAQGEIPRVARRPAPKRQLSFAILAGVLGVAALGAFAWNRERGPAAAPAAVILPDSMTGTALLLDGATSFVGTATGTIVTPQSDNITLDLMLRWGGRTKNEHQMIFYNGHGAVTGWGLLVTGRENGQADGTIAVLAGGITIVGTPLVLKPGTWQHLVAERRDGKLTVTLDDQSHAIGAFMVNPTAARYRAIERTTIGGDGTRDTTQNVFRGAIDRVRIRDLASNYFIDRWNFDEGGGSVTVGEKGALLYADKVIWTAAQRPTPGDAFWRRMELACGQAYQGALTTASPADSATFRGPLVLHLNGCEPNAIHAALHAGTDRSRTFVLARTPRGLRLTQEVHRMDGTRGETITSTEQVRDSGAFDKQEFSSTNRNAGGWTLEITPRDHITYARQGPGGAMSMKFDLKRTVVSPPPPWRAVRDK